MYCIVSGWNPLLLPWDTPYIVLIFIISNFFLWVIKVSGIVVKLKFWKYLSHLSSFNFLNTLNIIHGSHMSWPSTSIREGRFMRNTQFRHLKIWQISSFRILIWFLIQVVDLTDENFPYEFCSVHILPIFIIEGAAFVWILLAPSKNQDR